MAALVAVVATAVALALAWWINELLWGTDGPDAEVEGPPIVLSAEQPAVEGEITLRLNDRVRPAFEPGSGQQFWGKYDGIGLGVQVRDAGGHHILGGPVQVMISAIDPEVQPLEEFGLRVGSRSNEWWRWRTTTADLHRGASFDVECPTGEECVQRFRYRFELVDPAGRDRVSITEWSIMASAFLGSQGMPEGGEMTLEMTDPVPTEGLIEPVAVWEFPRDGTGTDGDEALPLTITYPPEAADAVVRFTPGRPLVGGQDSLGYYPTRFHPDPPVAQYGSGIEVTADSIWSGLFTEVPLSIGDCAAQGQCTLTGELLSIPVSAEQGSLTLIADVRESPDPFAPPSDAPVVFELG